jgi:hypothetical protein
MVRSAYALALPCGDSVDLAVFVRTSDGKILGSARRPGDASTPRFVSAGLDPAGKRLAVHLGNRLLIYEAPSGRRLGDHPIKGRNYFEFAGGAAVRLAHLRVGLHPPVRRGQRLGGGGEAVPPRNQRG